MSSFAIKYPFFIIVLCLMVAIVGTATAVMNDRVQPEELRSCSMHDAAVPGLPRIISPKEASTRTAT